MLKEMIVTSKLCDRLVVSTVALLVCMAGSLDRCIGSHTTDDVNASSGLGFSLQVAISSTGILGTVIIIVVIHVIHIITIIFILLFTIFAIIIIITITFIMIIIS
mmetsp:Transcript_73817/g.173194  ORF Transcript_73817/g.173194 Transcript_73817/m.173194 type:complete len:105 (+) Transcript_73817:296-610(+)